MLGRFGGGMACLDGQPGKIAERWRGGQKLGQSVPPLEIRPHRRRPERQHHQRHGHHARRLVGMTAGLGRNCPVARRMSPDVGPKNVRKYGRNM